MNQREALFEEKQFLGTNKYSFLRRMVLALFCFAAFYWSENPKPVNVSGVNIGAYPVDGIENSGQLFFLMGVVILVMSAILVFILHIHTVVLSSSVTIEGLWSSKKIEIDLKEVVSAEKITYSKFLLNPPVYNLHKRNKVNFFTGGNFAVELKEKSGLIYIIGSQRVDELVRVLKAQINQH